MLVIHHSLTYSQTILLYFYKLIVTFIAYNQSKATVLMLYSEAMKCISVFHVVSHDFTSVQVVKDLVTIFPVLRDWLAEFLNTNCIMTASDIGHNLLIEQVLMVTAWSRI